MKLRNNGIYILLTLSVLLTFLSAFITYSNTREKDESMHTVIRRYKSIASSINLLSLLKDMETGQRGYIISGDSDFLVPYNEAKAEVVAATDTLNRLVFDNEQQSNFINGRIMTAIENKTENLENVIKLVNTQGKDSAAQYVKKKIGLAYMDTLRVLIQDLIQREKILLDVQNKRLEKNTRIEDDVRFFAFALIALTSLVAIVRLWQKRQSIKELVDNLQEANQSLELKVEERTKALRAANQEKDHFLGIASHDLKVPIAGISGLVGLLKAGELARSETDLEYLNYIDDSCTTMQRLIADLLDINRIERGEVIVKKQPVDIARLLQKLRNEFTQLLEKKQMQLVVAYEEGTLFTDPDALLRILENLLSNAIKFSPYGKTIHLRSSRNNGSVSFEVIDQGPGIPAEEMAYLFKRFNRLSNKTTGGEESTGLGLSIVKELVNLLGGEISVTSTPQGSVFTTVFSQQPL